VYKVRIENVCSCFVKSAMAESLDFDTQEEAKEKAEKMIGIMKSDFCQKHDFAISETFGDYTIYIKSRI
jgi:hypothetical protein